MRPGANAPAAGHHVTTWRPSRGDSPSSEWPRISTQPSLTGQSPDKSPAAQGKLQLVCSLALREILREILREEKRRHECRSDNKSDVTAWESSPNQIARMHNTTRTTRATWHKSYTSRTQPLERRTEGEQANNKHFPSAGAAWSCGRSCGRKSTAMSAALTTNVK